MRVSIVLFLLLCNGAYAEGIYRIVSPDGEVTYTDERPPDGHSYEKVELPPESEGVNAGPVVSLKPDSSSSNSEAATPAYPEFRIIRPEDDTSVRANNGDVTIDLAIDPPLQARSGHNIVLLLDGEPVVQGNSLQFHLNNLDRGTHVLEAQVHSAAGARLASAAPVTFTVQRVAVGIRGPVSAP